jgi:pimeloyl-ACP methyl ester carboxylesterase
MTAWVLIRGLAREAGHWGSFPIVLSREFGHARVDCLDLPGTGQRREETSPLNVAAIVETLRERMRQLEIQVPVALLGLSMGGMVASAWAVRYPQEVSAAVLVNTSMRPFSVFWRRLRPSGALALAGIAMQRDPQQIEEAVLDLTSAQAPRMASVIGDWVRVRRERPVSRANVMRQLFAAARYRAPRAAPVPPVLVACGSLDRLVDPRCSRALAAAWQAPLLEHPFGGHDLPLDQGPWLVRGIVSWESSRGAR